MNKIPIVCDLTSKRWLNMEEAIIYLGFGSKSLFQEWRETGRLVYYKPGKKILYKRTDLDKMMESHRQGGFAQ